MSEKETLLEKAKQEGVKAQVEADERVKLLTKERDRLQRQLIQAKAQTNLIIQEAKEYLDSQNFVLDLPQPPPADNRRIREERAVLCVGDVHFGHYCDIGEHAFNKDIARDRMIRTVQKFIDTTRDRRGSAKIDHVHLYLIGDMVEGEMMRAGQSHEIEGPVALQGMRWAPTATAEVILALAAEFQSVRISAVPGNHGRNGRFGNGAHPLTNWDMVCYQTARHIVNNAMMQQGDRGEHLLDKLSWDLPMDRAVDQRKEAWIAIDYVFDWCNFIIHGENLRGKGWGGIPFYGVERMGNKLNDIFDDPVDFLYMGHIHVNASIPSNHRQTFVNGAIESATQFVRKDLVSSNVPSQIAVFYDPDRGPISHHTFYLSERVPQSKRTARALARRYV